MSTRFKVGDSVLLGKKQTQIEDVNEEEGTATVRVPFTNDWSKAKLEDLRLVPAEKGEGKDSRKGKED